MLSHLKRCWIWLSLTLLLGTMCFAQFNSSVQGTVTDQAGAVVAGANISLRNIDTGVEVGTTSNEFGLYRFNSVAPGRYTVKIEARGFAKREVNVQVTTNGTASADAKLAVAGATQEVVVTSEVTGVNTEETRTQATLSTREVAELPLMNRSLMSLAVVTPGVTGVNREERRDSFESGTPDINANGRPSNANLYMVDGMAVMSTNTRGNIDLMPSPDMVQEAAFQATTFSVENGAQSSMQADFTTKSGTNKFHGDFDYTFSSRGLAATREFQAQQTPFKRVYESGAFGGPIFKDKTFFFGSIQHKFWQMSDSGLANYITQDFANWGYNTFHSRSMKFYSVPPTRMAPTGKIVATGRDVNADCGTPAANMLPCDMPVLAEGNSLQTPKQYGLQYNFRLDHNIRDGKDRFYVNFFRVDSNMDWLAFDRPGADTKNYIISSYVNTNWTHQFTPNMLNFASFTTMRNWTGAKEGPYVVAPWGGVVFSPFYMLWGSYPLAPTQSKEHAYTFRDYVSIAKGHHNMKIGGHIYRPDVWQNQKQYARTASVNFLSMWDFARDVVFMESYWNISAQTGKYQPQIYGAKNYQYGVFFQDDWKVTPNLLLSAGIRMDDFGNPSNYGTDALPYVAVMRGDGTTLQDQISNTYTRFVDGAFAHRQKGNFMPRFGFNWNPKGDGKTVVRGGMGYYMDGVTPAEVTANLPTQPPNRISIDAAPWNSVQPIYNPWGTTTQAPYGFEQPNIGTPVIDSRGGVVGIQAGLNGIDYNLRTLKTLNWNFAIEREMPAKLVASVIYSGNHSWDQTYQFDYNHLANHVVTTNEFGAIKYTRNGESSNYNALIGALRQNWKNIQWQATYTWAHALDMPSGLDNDASSHDMILDGYNIAKYYGNAEFDVRRRFAMSGLFALPTLSHNAAAEKILGGWQLGTMFTAQSGTPFNVYTNGSDYNADGTTWDVPNYAGSYAGSGYGKTQYINGLFPSTAFTAPADGTQGNMPRNYFRNPGFMSLDTSLTKKTSVRWFGDQKATLSLRVEAINAFNRVNLYPVIGNLNDGNFGKCTKAYNGRYIQLGARIEF